MIRKASVIFLVVILGSALGPAVPGAPDTVAEAGGIVFCRSTDASLNEDDRPINARLATGGTTFVFALAGKFCDISSSLLIEVDNTVLLGFGNTTLKGRAVAGVGSTVAAAERKAQAARAAALARPSAAGDDDSHPKVRTKNAKPRANATDRASKTRQLLAAAKSQLGVRPAGHAGPGLVVFSDTTGVRIRGLTFTGFDSSDEDAWGGAITVFENSTVAITNNRFERNVANRGGAIGMCCNNDDSVISNNIFRQNIATCEVVGNCRQGSDGSGNGGAIWSWADTDRLKITNNQFHNNIARHAGGAVNAAFDHDRLEFSGNLCKANVAADKAGGCLRLADDNPNAIIQNNRFLENFANEANNDLSGGAVDAGWDAEKIKFIGNVFQSNLGNGKGGAVVVRDGAAPVTFTSNQFIGNHATNAGGAVRLARRASRDDGAGSCTTAGAKVGTFTGNLFQDNNSDSDGGALHARSANDCLTFANNRWISNQSEADGGAVQFEQGFREGGPSSRVSFTNEQFISNTAADSEDGGAMRFEAGMPRLRIANSVFRANKASNDGGAIDFSCCDSPNMVFTGLQFVDNSADDHGGAIDFAGGEVNDLLIEKSLFQGNFSNDDGGAIRFSSDTSSPVNIKNNRFISNHALEHGGAIAFNSALNDLTIEGNLFEGNKTADDEGGALNFSTAGDDVTIKNNIFRNNLADAKGGAINIGDAAEDWRITGNQFLGNSARDNGGGAIRNSGCLTDARIDANTFSGNRATGDGGALDLSNACSRNIRIDGNQFLQNTAEDGGAVLICCGHDNVTFERNLLENNNARGDGGGLRVEGNNPSLMVFNNLFKRNTAGSQGGNVAYDYIHCCTDLMNNHFFNNTVVFGSAPVGGGVHVEVSDGEGPLNFWNNISYLNLAGDLVGVGHAVDALNSIVGTTGGTATCTDTGARDDGDGNECHRLNPRFLSAAGQNFHLIPTLSPAINLGRKSLDGTCNDPYNPVLNDDGEACAPTTDFDLPTGRPGPDDPDAGAFEGAIR